MLSSENPEERKAAEEIEKSKTLLKKRKEYQSEPVKSEKETVNHLKDKLKGKKKKKTAETVQKEENVGEDGIIELTQHEQQKQDKLKELKEEQKKMKKEILSIGKKKLDEEKMSAEEFSALEEQRAKYLEKKRLGRPSEDTVLAKLDAFTKSLFTGDEPEQKGEEEEEEEEVKEGYSSNEEEKEEEDLTDTSWKNHKLKFKPEKKVKDASMLDDSDKYKTFDPLLLSKVKPMSQHKRRLAGEKKMEIW